MVKTITMRKSAFSQRLLKHMEFQLEKDKDATSTGIIVELCERGLTAQQQDTRQNLGSAEEYFQLPPWSYCPNSREWHLRDTLYAPKSGICHSCESKKKGCSAWRRGI